VRQSIIDMPNYTCLETMDRTITEPSGQIEFRERLRVEVLVANHQELFAWPGSTNFADLIGDWIGSGAIGTGNFWTNLHNLFVGSGASVKFAGVETVGGESLYRFDFRVPSLSSQYSLTIAGRTATTAYSGSFWVEKNSLDLVRVDTRAEDIPPNLDCLQERTSVTYSRVRLGSEARLLAATSQLEIVNRNNYRSHNTIGFTGCRHYGAVSAVSFDGQPATSATGEGPRDVLKLPANLTLTLKLDRPITTEDSAAGDEITAVLDKPVKSGDIRLEKGARVLGRIRRLEQHSKTREPMTMVAMEFYAVDAPQGRIRIKVRLTGPVAVPGQALETPAGLQFSPGTVGLDIVDAGASTGVGRFQVPGKNLHLARGFRTVWKTE
jgi:hypothetical protein